jgi:hypothetical protein
MKLFFKPAELELSDNGEGQYTLTMAGKVVGVFASQKSGVAEYNRLRRKLEEEFPMQEPTAEEKQALLQRLVAENLVQHNSFKPPEKKTASRKSRTFG